MATWTDINSSDADINSSKKNAFLFEELMTILYIKKVNLIKKKKKTYIVYYLSHAFV